MTVNNSKAKLKQSKTKKAKKEIQVDSDFKNDNSIAMLQQVPISKKRKIVCSHLWGKKKLTSSKKSMSLRILKKPLSEKKL